MNYFGGLWAAQGNPKHLRHPSIPFLTPLLSLFRTLSRRVECLAMHRVIRASPPHVFHTLLGHHPDRVLPESFNTDPSSPPQTVYISNRHPYFESRPLKNVCIRIIIILFFRFVSLSQTFSSSLARRPRRGV